MTHQLVASVATVEAIVRLAQHYPVFPCRRHAEEVTSKGRVVLRKPKSPLTERGFLDASRDPDQIRAWWRRWPDAFVGVPTGALTGLFVLDYDAHKASAEAQQWMGEHSDWLLATRVHGTLNGGKHYLYCLPPGQDFASGSNVQLGGTTRTGIDVRAAGGYVIWWPLHGGTVSGDLAALPAGMADERRVEKREHKPLPATSPEKWARDRARVAEALAWVEAGDYDNWIRIGQAVHLASQGSEDGFALWHAWSSGEITGDVPVNYGGESDCRNRWDGFNKGVEARAKVATLGTVFALAGVAGWVPSWRSPEPMPTDEPPIGEPPPWLEGEASAPATAADADADAAPRIRAEPFVFVPPSQIPPRPWIYGRHYMRGMVSATAGIGGAGKSSVLITEAISMALGKDLFQAGAELPAGPQVVWLHNGEDPMDELQRRFGAALQHYGVDPQQLGNRLRVTSGRTMPIMLAESMSAGGKVLVPTEDGRLLAQELIREKVAALLVDPFVTLHRVSENDNVMIDGVMTVMRNIAHDSMAAIELAHHFRKMNGQEASVDDVRGASSIVGACRSVRIVAPMSKEESDKYGLPEEERRGFIWLQNGKANMLPPTHARRWMQMVSVELGNAAEPYDGDKVGVPVAWDPPDARYDLTPPQWRAIRQAIVEAPQPLNNLRYDVRASGWVGKVVAATLEVDLADGTARNNVRGLIERWVKSGRLAVESVRDPKQGRDAQVVRWVDSEAS